MSLKVVNWNLWNSFKKISSPFYIEFLEPKRRILQRRAKQQELFYKSDFDILFLQEVNPVRSINHFLKKIKYNTVYSVDQAGFKVLGFGLPNDFENGLVIASREPLRHLESAKLSDKIGFTGKYLSLQFEELRYAQFIEYKGIRDRILLINTHIHHGIEWSEELQLKLEDVVESGLISKEEYYSTVEQIAFSTQRKRLEIEKLVDKIKSYQKHYYKILLCGDFNFSDNSVYLEMIKSTGLVHNKWSGFYTWDPLKNERNTIFSNQLPPPVKGIKNKKIIEILREYDKRPRNLDYVFSSENLFVNDIQLFGDEPTNFGFYPSDHYGIQFKVDI